MLLLSICYERKRFYKNITAVCQPDHRRHSALKYLNINGRNLLVRYKRIERLIKHAR